MANLYHNRESNIQKTWLLFVIFFVAVIGIGYLLAAYFNNPNILIFASVFSLLTSWFSYWYSDKLALSMAKASSVTRENARELYNIVENLSITAGLPVPKIYLIGDGSPNAFATGRNPKNAVVAVTTGLMEKLDRSELEGVLSHELSHIGNRDMLVSTVAVVLVGFIAVLSDMFTRSIWFGGMRSRDDNDSRAGGILVIVGIALSILAPIIASLIHLAISRRREFLADTSGALLTRYPEGLANALEKISTYQRPMRTASNATAHLFLENPFGADSRKNKKTSWLVKIFSTHPPIEERIKILRDLKI